MSLNHNSVKVSKETLLELLDSATTISAEEVDPDCGSLINYSDIVKYHGDIWRVDYTWDAETGQLDEEGVSGWFLDPVHISALVEPAYMYGHEDGQTPLMSTGFSDDPISPTLRTLLDGILQNKIELVSSTSEQHAEENGELMGRATYTFEVAPVRD